MGGKSSAAVRYPWLTRRSLANRLFSRPGLGAGLVALRQAFVRRCHGGLGSSRACPVLAIQRASSF